MSANLKQNSMHVRPFFDFNFSTMMMFKCTQRKYAESIKKGNLYFGTPENWVKEELKGNKGQGDVLEGTFLTASLDDNTDLISGLKENKDIEHFEYKGNVYFRYKKILRLKCSCFYGLNSNMFNKEIDESGIAHYKFVVPRSYFRDFAECETWEEYEKIPNDEKPSVVFINNPHEFFKRVREAFVKLNVPEKDVIISPVDYINKNEKMISKLPYPLDLFVKDEAFKNQSEIRIVINNYSPKYLKYMLEHNNTVNIGDISDIVDIYEYYFDDMKIERMGNRSLMFSLPQIIEKNIDSLNFFELYDLLLNILGGTVKITRLSDKVTTWQEKLKKLTDLFYTKFGVMVYVDEKKNISMYNLSNDLMQKMNKRDQVSIERDRLEKRVLEMLNNNKNKEALELCEEFKDDKNQKGFAHYYIGKIYKKLGQKDKAIEAFEISYLQDYKPIESLDGIASIYFRNREYDKAIVMYKKIQDVKGYDPMIWCNISVCYMNMNEFSEAIQYLDKAEELDNNDAYIYYNRGVAYYKLEDYKNAEKDMYRATVLAPENQHYLNEYNRCFKK